VKRKRALAMTYPAQQSAARLLVVLVTLLAFGLQSYVTQTHIHLKAGTFGSYSSLNKETQPRNDKFPGSGDPANCPICQEIAHTGQFLTPSAAALLLPVLAISIIAVVTAIPLSAQRPSHIWRSRAPPKV
jgi:hypothetical protein